MVERTEEEEPVAEPATLSGRRIGGAGPSVRTPQITTPHQRSSNAVLDVRNDQRVCCRLFCCTPNAPSRRLKGMLPVRQSLCWPHKALSDGTYYALSPRELRETGILQAR